MPRNIHPHIGARYSLYLTAAWPLAQSSPETMHLRSSRESVRMNENGNACIWQLEDVSYTIVYSVLTASSSICSLYSSVGDRSS